MKEYRRRSLRFDESGISLISVLVAVGILGIISAGSATVMQMMSQQARYWKLSEDNRDLKFQVTSLLSDPNNCLSVFDGATFDLKNIGPTATHQALGSAPEFSPGTPVTSVASGGLKVRELRLLLQRRLSPTANIYQGLLLVEHESAMGAGASLPPLKPKEIPLNLDLLPGAGFTATVGSCSPIGIPAGGGGGGGGAASFPYGSCGPGQVVTGITADGVTCSAAFSQAPPAAGPAAGTGCTDTGCSTSDFGPCTGDGCATNGYFCKGVGCVACGLNATCTGVGCCAGPSCKRGAVCP